MSPAPLAPGVWGVVATPFTGPDHDVDETSLTNLGQVYETAGVTGLTVLGVFGEAATLASDERRRVLETVVAATALPLVVGVTSIATAPAVEEIRLAQDAVGDRLAGAMVQASSAQPQALTRHLQAVHDATGTGLVVQDYPLVSGVHIAPAVLAETLRPLPYVVAVKAEAPPTPVSVATLTQALDVPVFGGLGGLGLLDELAAGAAGAMTGFSYPEGLLACVEAWRTGGYDAAREVWAQYLPLVNFEQQPRIGLAIRKECLRRRGLIEEASVRPPAPPLPDVLLPQLERHLERTPA